MLQSVFLTGSTGFVGSAVLRRLVVDGVRVVAAVRHESDFSNESVQVVRFASLDCANWLKSFSDVDAVVHCAARVHDKKGTDVDRLAAFRKVNVEGTLNLAEQAAKAGVRRFVFISSIKVNGEETQPGSPYLADDKPAPKDPYGVSKFEAELGLRAIASRSAMEVVIIRPVLVYGPGVKANFLSMMRWLDKGIPLPLGAIDNRRSLVALDNLVDLIITAISHPAAANQTFLVSDGDDLSTPQLLRNTAASLGKSARLFPVPAWVVTGVANLVGKKILSQRLCGSLQVDIQKTENLMQWKPRVSASDALMAVSAQYMSDKRK